MSIIRKIALDYYKKMFKTRIATIKAIDKKLFNEYYEIYERNRLEQYGVGRLYKDTADVLADETYYEWSERLAYRYRDAVRLDKIRRICENGTTVAVDGVALGAVAGALFDTNVGLAIFAGMFAVAVAQNIKYRKINEWNLNKPYLAQVYDEKALDMDKCMATRERYADMAAIRFRRNFPLHDREDTDAQTLNMSKGN